MDGNSYLDYGLAWGHLILGHAPPEILEAVTRQLQKGFTFGAQHDLEFEVAEKLVEIIPCADAVCFANSGSEAVQLALRLARAATGRKKVLKFEGHYHGSTEGILVSYHPTPTQIAAAEGDPIPVGPGQVPPDHVIVTEWNSVAGVEEAFAFAGSEIAAVICEPLLCNSGCIPPLPGFLDFLRRITERHHAVLIFDEVITGFRLDLRGAQGYYEVTPDLATYGKAVGGGVPVSVLAGRSELMSLISERKVVHMGTLNGNPFSLSAVRATLEVLSRDDGAIFSDLHRRGKRLREGLQRHLQAKGLQVVTSGEGPVFQLSFMDKPPTNYRQTLAADRAIYSDFAVSLLDERVFVLPDGRWYLSAAHSDEDVEATLAAAELAIEPIPE